jgi:hypothetical protein
VNRAVPEWLASLIDALHAKSPDQRIQSAAEVVTALQSRTVPEDRTEVIQAAPETRRIEFSPSRRRGSNTYAVVLSMVFLLSLPGFYFLLPKDDEMKPEERRQSTGKQDTRSTPPEQPRVVPNATPNDNPAQKKVAAETDQRVMEKRPDPVKEPKKSKAPAWEVQGTVVVLLHDTTWAAWLKEEGLTAREQSTSKVVTLKQGRNDIPVGEYRLEGASPPTDMKLSPRRFTVTAETIATVNVGESSAATVPNPGGKTVIPDDPPDRPPPHPFRPPPPPPPRGR